MSISSLADDEISRVDKANLKLARIVEPQLTQLVSDLNLSGTQIQTARAALQPLAAENPIQKTKGSATLDGLVKYIPTETVTLYVAATAALSSLTAALPWITAGRLYWGFVIFTPVLFLLIYIGKRRTQNLPFLPQSVAQWPWWKMIAATIAFIFWALAIPPLIETPAGKIVAAFGALFVSTMLTVIGAIVEPTTD
jgi:hypothetical protein